MILEWIICFTLLKITDMSMEDMNWIKKILGLKTDKQCAIHSVSGSLSIEQLGKADMWYCLHKNHVNKLYHLAENSFPPTLNEDKNNPSLWKAGHWKWYLESKRYENCNI